MTDTPHSQHVYALAKTQLYLLQHYTSPHNEPWCYHTQFSYFLQIRKLSLPLFHKAVRNVLGRHPVLKTVIIFKDQEPYQAINHELDLAIHYEDISSSPGFQQEERLKAYEIKDRQKPFNLYDNTQPLLRTAIFKRDIDKIQLILSVNHCIWDGWSLAILLKEIFAHYQILKIRPTIALPQASYDYKEFLVAEEKTRQSADARNFWMVHLKAHQSFFPGKIASLFSYADYTPVVRHLPQPLIDRLSRLQQQLRVTMKTIFFGFFVRMIQDETGLNYTTINVVTNGRTVDLSNPLGTLGLLWNFAPVCVERLTDDAMQLKAAGKALASGTAYGTYPLWDILQDMGVKQLSHAAFNYINFEGANLLDEYSDVHFLEVGGMDKFHFPLHLLVGKNPFSKQISLVMNYDTRYYIMTQIEDKIDLYIKRLEGITGLLNL